MIIRDAAAGDAAAITHITNDVKATLSAIFDGTPVTEADRAAWIVAQRAAGRPVHVAEVEGAVRGFATYQDFKAGVGYRFTVDHSVHVAAEWRGRGIGRRLVQQLITHARQAGKRAMVASISGDNLGSVRMHQGLGFRQVALFPKVGFKWDRHFDLICLQLDLTAEPAP